VREQSRIERNYTFQLINTLALMSDVRKKSFIMDDDSFRLKNNAPQTFIKSHVYYMEPG
jgi:hypothetical protein